MRPLDRISSIKVKLSLVIIAAVAITAVVSVVGFRTGIPVWARPIISAVIGVVLVYPFARGITSPLREMAAASKAMARGDYSHPVTSTSRDEVGELAKAFDAMRSELAEVDRQRRDLVANAAHELRTPLAVLRARFENIVDGVEVADAANVQGSLGEVERLGRLLDQLLDLSRIESGSSPLELSEFDVTAMLEEVASAAREGDTASLVEVDTDRPVRGVGDEAKLRSVVANLIQNATRYAPGDAPVVLAAHSHATGIAITVTDCGPGIPPDERHRVFERFYRLDHGRSSASGGAGLGLAIAAGIVDLHDGDIDIQQNEPSGCRVVVSIPQPRRHRND